MPANSIPSSMESKGSANESGLQDQLLGTSPGASSSRERTDSESSEIMTRFVLPSMDGSPPKVLTLNEVAHVFKNIQNMELAHEIALNPDFKLQPYEPPADSLEHRLKDILHKAFWDLLREQLQQTPPCYEHAIKLLADIKECFPQILSPQNKRALDHINEVLDETVIKQQVERGLLDFKSYAHFVIQIMAKSCAPARDEAVQKLRDIDDVVDTFKGILETMSLMKLDMANYLLDYARNDIMANSVEYEKEKFKEYLEYYKFGFPATENWLKRNRTINANSAPSTKDQTIYNAYMELIDWPENIDFPEVLSMDKERILKLGQRAKRTCVAASLMSICLAIPIISQRSVNRLVLAQQIEILLQDIQDEKGFHEAMESIFEYIQNFLNEALRKGEEPNLPEPVLQQIKQQVLQIGNKESPVRLLMWKRLQTYVRLCLHSSGVIATPPGYSDYSDQMEAFTTALKRVIAYNHSVFGEYFFKILSEKRSPAPVRTEDDAGSADK